MTVRRLTGEAKLRRIEARLTRAPVSAEDLHLIERMWPGRKARWCTATERRFLRSLQGVGALTARQRAWLHALARKYRR